MGCFKENNVKRLLKKWSFSNCCISLICPLPYIVSYFSTDSIAMLYLVHKYKEKFESTNMDLTHSKIMIFLAFPVRGYGCSTSHTILPFTIECKCRIFFGHT